MLQKYLDRLRQLLKEGTAASDLELTTLVQLRVSRHRACFAGALRLVLCS